MLAGCPSARRTRTVRVLVRCAHTGAIQPAAHYLLVQNEESTISPAQVAKATLWRQGVSLGGGSNEIQRNIISERLLGMPREHAADRDVPYRDVRRGGTGDRR